LEARFGSRELALKAINAMLTTCAEDIRLLRHAYEHGDDRNVLIRLHRVLGGLNVVGPDELIVKTRSLMDRVAEVGVSTCGVEVERYLGDLIDFTERLERATSPR